MRTAPLSLVDEKGKPELVQMVRASQALAIDHNPGVVTAYYKSVVQFPLGTLRPVADLVGKFQMHLTHSNNNARTFPYAYALTHCLCVCAQAHARTCLC
jgi:hypothetical protein